MENRIKLVRQLSSRNKLLRLNTIKDHKDSKISKCDKLLIHPDSRFKIIWDLTIIILSVYNSLLIPYEFAYDIDQSIFLEIVDRMIDTIFIIDIFINFRTMYKDSRTDEFVGSWK
jgi:hypothetical protein